MIIESTANNILKDTYKGFADEEIDAIVDPASLKTLRGKLDLDVKSYREGTFEGAWGQTYHDSNKAIFKPQGGKLFGALTPVHAVEASAIVVNVAVQISLYKPL